MASPEFTSEMLAGLGDHLFREGIAAYEEKDFEKSLIWFSQCLDVCRNFDDTERTVGRILFFIGAIYSYLKNREQIMGFCEAFVNICQKQPPELYDGQRLVLTGAVCFHNGNPALAGRAFKTALRFFQELDLPRDISVAQEQLQKLGKLPLYRIQSREFLVRLGQKPVFKFTVTVDGKVKWGESQGLSHSMPVGSRLPWNTICTNVSMKSHRRIGFGDKVRVRSIPATKTKGLAGLIGQVYGETTPSITQVEVIGDLTEDYAINVFFEKKKGTYWFASELLEFIDHAPGTEIRIDDKKWIRTETGEWKEI